MLTGIILHLRNRVVMKKIFGLIGLVLLVFSCNNEGNITFGTETKETNGFVNDTVSIGSIQCFMYEKSSKYNRFETSDVLDEAGIELLKDTFKNVINEGSILYFHIFGQKSRGLEYATYFSEKMGVLYADKVVRTAYDAYLVQATENIDLLNDIHEVQFGQIHSILNDLDKCTSYLQLAKTCGDQTTSNIKEFSKLTTRLTQLKNKLYPKMRQAYFRKVKGVMWENNVEVKMSGKSLYFYGSVFFDNKVKKESYDQLREIVNLLRFNRICFGPYEGGEYTYWNCFEGKDSD